MDIARVRVAIANNKLDPSHHESLACCLAISVRIPMPTSFRTPNGIFTISATENCCLILFQTLSCPKQTQIHDQPKKGLLFGSLAGVRCSRPLDSFDQTGIEQHLHMSSKDRRVYPRNFKRSEHHILTRLNREYDFADQLHVARHQHSPERDKNRVRVNAQLIDSETGAHLWADRFEEDFADLFKLQDQVVARLANTLGYELIKAEAQKSGHSTNPDAIDLTMSGWVAFWQQTTKESVALARGYFEHALKLDPQIAEALTGLAFRAYPCLALRLEHESRRGSACRSDGIGDESDHHQSWLRLRLLYKESHLVS
jgi:hypothetical protein